jgi:hypothetical protein
VVGQEFSAPLQVTAEEVEHELGDLGTVGLECEITRVEQVQLGVG